MSTHGAQNNLPQKRRKYRRHIAE